MSFTPLLELALVGPIILVSLSFHEFAHGWVALRCGDMTASLSGRLSLNPLKHVDWFGTVALPCLCVFLGLPFVGWAKPVPVDVTKMRRGRIDLSLVALAGPVSNLALCAAALLLFAVVLHIQGAHYLWQYLQVILLLAIQCNLALALFNLLPIPPLDGFNIVQSMLPTNILILVLRYSWILTAALIVAVFTGGLNFLVQPVEYLFHLMLAIIR